MKAYSDLNRSDGRSTTNEKVIPVPISTSRRLVEPFNRLRNRANLFRRKNFSSQLSIDLKSTDHQSSSTADHIVPSNQLVITNIHNTGDSVLKRSNSMICPQQHLQTFLNQNNNNNTNINQRNSICFELAGCSTDESSTDDYQLVKSSSNNHYWTKPISSTMNDIDEHEVLLSMSPPTIIEESNINLNDENNVEEEQVLSSLPNHNNNSEHTSAILPLSQSTMDVILKEKEDKEKQEEQISSTTIPTSIISSSHSSSSSASTVILRDHAETIRTRRQCHSSISLLQHQQRQQALSFPFDQPIYDCKPQSSPKKSDQHLDMSLTKVSTCTMTGKSLNNLDESSSTSATISSEEKGVQTTLNDPSNPSTCVKRAISSTSLSSSSASIQIDSLEKKPKMPVTNTMDETTSTNDMDPPANSNMQYQNELTYKWPHVCERLLGEQTCIYWVNYLGSTAIKMLDDGTTAMPSQAISRLKQSTQYARVLPIIGLSISSRGVEFLKHAKDRVVICFHDIKSIHCACQDEDLRYFAYVTREQRPTNGMSHTSSSTPTNVVHDNKQQPPSPSPSFSTNGEFHHYCHVFVVKSEAMSTEIMLTFGQAFDIAYRLHRRLKLSSKKSKDIHTPLSPVPNGERLRQLEVIRLSTKSDIKHNNNVIMSSSTHSPATSSSSSSMDDRKIFM